VNEKPGARQVDLERVISEKEMASLYYRLQDCDEPKNSPELLSGPVFVNTMATIKESNRFSFYAAVPRNIEDEISQFQAMLGNSSEVKSSSICIRLGAGNMAGEVLVSNLVPLGIGSQVSD
jgi:hypothetical protein